MIFWIGWTAALLAGLFSIEAARHELRRRYPRLTSLRLDVVLVALLLSGLGISAWEHIASEREVRNLRVDLDRRTAPWRLSPEQRKRILADLGPKPSSSVLIVCRLMDGESCDMAADLAAVLKGAGWIVVGPGENSLNSFFGIDVFSKSASGPLGGADRLFAALSAAGLPCRSELVPADSLGGPVSDGTICVIVGRRLL